MMMMVMMMVIMMMEMMMMMMMMMMMITTRRRRRRRKKMNPFLSHLHSAASFAKCWDSSNPAAPGTLIPLRCRRMMQICTYWAAPAVLSSIENQQLPKICL